MSQTYREVMQEIIDACLLEIARIRHDLMDKNPGQDISLLRNPDGSYVVMPLITAQSNLILAEAILKGQR